MKNAKEFLKLCERRFPSPRPNQRHCLTIENDTLVLTLMLGDTCENFNFDLEDLDKSAIQLFSDFISIAEKSASSIS